MKILLFGADGQVGWELRRSLAPLGEVVALTRASGLGGKGDLSDLDGIAATIHEIRPQVIVNAAAFTKVDQAETDRELAFQINGYAPEVMSRVAKTIGALVVHYSTDYVYSGAGENPWLETDSTDPVNAYGASKLYGDQAIASSGANYIIFRTSWVYAARGKNFIRTILALARAREELSIVNDQFGAPTGADLIADVTAHCIRDVTRPPEFLSVHDLYHLCASGVTTWRDYAIRVLNVASKIPGVNLKASGDCVRPLSAADYPTSAKRPENSRLCKEKLERTFNLLLPAWGDGVDRAVTEIASQLNTEN